MTITIHISPAVLVALLTLARAVVPLGLLYRLHHGWL